MSTIGTVALLGGDVPYLMNAVGSSMVGPLAKILVAFPLVYHYLGGLRHYMWDKDPGMLSTPDVTRSSYILFGASGIITLGLSVVSI